MKVGCCARRMTGDEGERFNRAVGDRYQMARQLGRGGMATVDLADDRRLQPDF